MIHIKNYTSVFKDRLVNIGSGESLSTLSLTVIIALDIFILFVVFQGLDDHTRQLTSPDEYMPRECQDVFIRHNWSDANFLTNLQNLVLSEHNNYSYRGDIRFKKTDTENIHDACRKFYTNIRQIMGNKELKALFIDRQALIKEKNQLRLGLKKSKDVYDTSLLENIADQKGSAKGLPAVKATIASHKVQIEKITRDITSIEATINSHSRVLNLKEMISVEKKYRQNIVDDFKKFQKIYPLKELGWQFLFLMPLFLIFYIWGSRSVKKSNQVQILISTHLLIIISIPIILKVIEVVLDLIPRHFFKNFFNILKSLHIIAIWHYIVIFLSVCIGLLAVYIIQKKIFNHQRIQLKRLMKGACHCCGKKLPQGSAACPFCGTKQFKTCDNCREQTYLCGDFCKNCGHKLLKT